MHFSVLVLGEDPECLLEPYNENTLVSPYVEVSYDELRKRYPDITGDKEIFRRNLIENGEVDEGSLDNDCNMVSTYNPLSKWDWYTYGGRWADLAYEVDGPLGEANFKNSDKYIQEVGKFWDGYVVEGLDPPEDAFLVPSREYFREAYGDKETFIKACTYRTTRAIITPDGKWHEADDVFSEGKYHPEKETDFALHYFDILKDIDQNTPACIVDCHI